MGDNVYPHGLTATTTGNPATITGLGGTPPDMITASSNASIPTLSEWGMIIFFALLVLSALVFGRRKRRTA